ncbi:MAG TPA: fused MFS/spermidine synthase [Anaerolineaceae bacterium]|nr:fused MFS/spermidine synthase [Anaerolineaceae bacterium]
MRKLIYITVFISGLTSLALEMAASRMLGNYFGTSNLVWASIIGLILIYLTIGYFLGGAWADRSPHYRTFFQILLWAAFSIAVIPLISRPILRLAANAFDQLELGVLAGSFTVVMVLFIVPVVLLGTASPFAIRLSIEDSSHAGSVSGHIYAVSTLGSFLGTFLPVLVLIPLVGTYRTFLIISAILLVTALAGLAITVSWRQALTYIWMPIVVALLAVFGIRGFDKSTEGLVYEKDSAYNYIQVLEQDGYHLLRLNEGQGVHSVYHPDRLNYYGPWEQVLVAPFFNPAPYDPARVERMAIVGLAGGTTARQASAVFPNVQIDGIEIDPEIVAVGKEFFGMDLPNLNVIVQDGRWGLEHSPERYQIISVDAYRPPYIPWHMTTREFFQSVQEHLTEDGVLVINIGRGPDDRRLVDALGTTIGTVFPSIHVMDVPGSFNTILFATNQETHYTNLKENFDRMVESGDVHPLLVESAFIALENLQNPPQPSLVFTDDYAPVEWITNSMIFDFFVTGDSQNLQ